MFALPCAARPLTLLPLALLPLILSACGGADSGTSGMSMSVGTSMGTSMGSSGAPPSTQLSADFDSIQANIFTPICSGCHSGAHPAENLNLDATHSYNDLVNVPSTEKPNVLRVKPGDPMDSELVQHLQTEGDGAPASDIPFIQQWITDGAMPGASAMSTAAFQVGAVEPEDGAALASSPSRIVIGFTQVLSPASIGASAIQLEHLPQDPDQATQNIVTSMDLSAGNGRALTLIPSKALPAGNYRVVLNSTSGSQIFAQNGAALDPAATFGTERVLTRFSIKAEQ